MCEGKRASPGLPPAAIDFILSPLRGYPEIIMVRLVALLMVALPFVAGCNTIEGIGKDLKKVGESVEDAARQERN